MWNLKNKTTDGCWGGGVGMSEIDEEDEEVQTSYYKENNSQR